MTWPARTALAWLATIQARNRRTTGLLRILSAIRFQERWASIITDTCAPRRRRRLMGWSLPLYGIFATSLTG